MIPSTHDVQTTVGITVNRHSDIKFMVNQDYPGSITLVLGDSAAEISFERHSLEILRDRADEAIRRVS